MAIAKPGDLCTDTPPGGRHDLAEISERDRGTFGSHEHPDEFHYLAAPRQEGKVVNPLDVRVRQCGHGCSSRSWDKPRSISFSWVSREASSVPRLISKMAPPLGWIGSLITSTAPARPTCSRHARTTLSRSG